MRAFLLVLALSLVAALAFSTTAQAQPDRPDPCRDYGACVMVCVSGVQAWCPGTVCVGFSTQIPVCVPKFT